MGEASNLDHKTAAAINRRIGEALRDHLEADYAALPAQLKARLAELQRACESSTRPDATPTSTERTDESPKPGLARTGR